MGRQGARVSPRLGEYPEGGRGVYLTLIVLALVTLAAACTDSPEVAFTTLPTGTSAATSPPAPGDSAATSGTASPATNAARPYGGEVVIGTGLEPPTLNVFLPGGYGSIGALIANAHMTGVFKVDGDTLDLVPEVVTELPTVANGGISLNEDGTETITYSIRQDALWADGTPISGDDFAFTFETIMDPANPIDRTGYDRIDPDSLVVGPKSFEFTLRSPTLDAEFLFGVLIPRHAVEGSEFATDWNAGPWVSGGPFVFQEWRRGEFISFTRNPNYWKTDELTGQRQPFLDRLEIRFSPDSPALLNAFRERTIDLIPALASPESAAALDDLVSRGAEVQLSPSAGWEHLAFQFGEGRTERNPGSYNHLIEYRRAVAHAIDRSRIAAEITGTDNAALSSHVEAYSAGLSTGAWDRYPYDPDRARDLLGEMCARPDTDCDANPPSLVFTAIADNPERAAVATLLAEMLEEVGIAYEAQLEDSLTFFGETFDFGIWDLAQWDWTGSAGLSALVAAQDLFDPAAVPPGGANYYRWGTPAVTDGPLPGFDQGPSSISDEHTARFEELVGLMAGTIDRDELVGYLQEAEQILADQVVFIPLYRTPAAAVVWADEVAGFRHAPDLAGGSYLALSGDGWNVEFWYRKDLEG